MNVFRAVRLPLLTLVLLATLLLTSSAFAAAPVAKESKTQRQTFSTYANYAGGGCMYDHIYDDQMSASDD